MKAICLDTGIIMVKILTRSCQFFIECAVEMCLEQFIICIHKPGRHFIMSAFGHCKRVLCDLQIPVHLADMDSGGTMARQRRFQHPTQCFGLRSFYKEFVRIKFGAWSP